MSTTTFRRTGDRSLKTSWPGLGFRYRFLLIFFSLILALTVVLFFPYEWLSKKSHEFRDSAARVGAARPSEKVIEVMTDFHFVTDETNWIASGRKTKRIHVVDKANQVVK